MTNIVGYVTQGKIVYLRKDERLDSAYPTKEEAQAEAEKILPKFKPVVRQFSVINVFSDGKRSPGMRWGIFCIQDAWLKKLWEGK